MARASVRSLLWGAPLWLLACSGDVRLGDYPPSSCDLAEPPADVRDATFSIATFWSSDDHEDRALRTLTDRIDRRRYFVSFDDMTTRIEAQRHINDAFVTKRLPDVFQVNGGNDVLRWVEGHDSASTDVCSLDRLRDEHDWNRAYFSTALAPLTCRGHLYGLPVGIHHLNVLFYNRKLFTELQQHAQAQGTPLRDLSELQSPHELVAELAAVAQLAAKTADGADVIPLALGAGSEWPLTVVAFENVLLGLGHDAYETLWQGGLENDDGSRAAELRASLEEMVSVLRELTGFSNVSQPVSWQDALRQVGSGQALMTVTGDWGWAQLDDSTVADVDTVTFPGTQGAFVYTPDSFAVPRELRKDGSSARSFLHEVVESRAALIDFARLKHSIPPRRDLEPDEIDSLGNDALRSTYQRFLECNRDTAGAGCKLLLAVSGLGPPPGTDHCFDEIDAILTLAVTGVSPVEDAVDDESPPRLCTEPFPHTKDEAAARLLQLLLRIGEQRFAADCR